MALNTKEQEVAAVGVSVAVGCKPCAIHHMRAARAAGASDEDLKGAVTVALSVHESAVDAMQRFFLTRLGEPRRRSASGDQPPPSRQDALTAVGVAFAVNATSDLPRHMAAARAAGLTQDDVDAMMKLARLIKGRGAFHVDRHVGSEVEERVFVFLDLADSTTLTERLGHVDYSRFIRACYHDLSGVLIQYKAQIYQYVGDEVVLSWDLRDGVRDNTCLELVFAYQSRLLEKRTEYEREFGVAPVFRGSMDLGAVTRTQVGDVKRDLAYHGNVLNVASRLQGLCKTYDEPLLITHRVDEALPGGPRFATRLLGQVVLRGQSEEVGVFGVDFVAEMSG